jgi:hypothetical protein
MLHKKSFGVNEFLGQRYHYARSYAGMRLRQASFGRRLVYAGFAATLLSPMLLGRISRNGWSRKRFRYQLVRSLPLLALFTVVWAWGVVVGYLLGPSDSLARVE